ncbi:hypothetical protein ACGFIP_22540 [Micromonospora zamorensis]|uniref:hypothetical protein n=1 Tax=Micromonospora zamorensis TaxID=709883 RepID=UPI00371F3CCA
MGRFLRDARALRLLNVMLLVIILALLMMDAFNVSIFPRGAVDPNRAGNIGEWFAGTATAGAVIVAATGLRRDRLRVELERERRERAAAGDVYAWVESRRLRPGRKSYVLVLVNRTPSPVFDWEASLEGESSALSHDTHGPILPGERMIELDEDHFALVPAQSPPKSALSFTTSLGTRLLRESSGILSEVTP